MKRCGTRAMPCPQCKNPTRVYATERRRDGGVLRRRRCDHDGCWLKFTTIERVVPTARVYVSSSAK